MKRERRESVPARQPLGRLGPGLPGTWFHDPAHYARELEAFWYAGWIAVARDEEIPAAGDYRVVPIGTQSIFVVRAGDGTCAPSTTLAAIAARSSAPPSGERSRAAASSARGSVARSRKTPGDSLRFNVCFGAILWRVLTVRSWPQREMVALQTRIDASALPRRKVQLSCAC
jgi:hypothetical protein